MKRINAPLYFNSVIAQRCNSAPTVWLQVIEKKPDKSGLNRGRPPDEDKGQRFSLTEKFPGTQTSVCSSFPKECRAYAFTEPNERGCEIAGVRTYTTRMGLEP
jgi:hypothetical protein